MAIKTSNNIICESHKTRIVVKIKMRVFVFSCLFFLTGCATEPAYNQRKFSTLSCGVYLPNTPYVACKNEMQSGEGYTPTKNNISLNSHRNTKPIAPSSTENVSPKPRSNRSGFDCAGKSTCGQMTSCAEARFYLNSCGVKKLDRDGDGIPCESICN